MFVRSTGLGRTLLSAKVAKIETTEVVPSTLEPPKDGTVEPMRMLMVIQVVNPVNWTVRAFVDPSDLRHMVKVVLTNPMLILKGIKFFFSKDPIYATPQVAETAAGTVAPGPAAATAAQTAHKTGPATVPKAGPGPMPPAPSRTGPGLIPPAPAKQGPGPIPPRR